MFLLDTNCWLQVARQRPHADEVRDLLNGVLPSRLFITAFSVHSIGNIMLMRRWAGYGNLLKQLSIGNRVRILSLDVGALSQIEVVCSAYGLDFDDGFQYVAAETNRLKIVSFDADFDRTPSGRLLPAVALELSRKQA